MITPARLAELIEMQQKHTDDFTVIFSGGTNEPERRALQQSRDYLSALRELESARTTLEGVRADAARYRWLRQCTAGQWDAMQDHRLYSGMENLDAAIDAVMEAQDAALTRSET